MVDKENSWNDKLTVGEKFEQKSIEYIKKKYPLAHKFLSENSSELKYYDIIIPELFNNEIVGVECKYDEEALNSNNLCIEIKCNGIESGLHATKSKYWLHCDGNKTYLALTDRIKELVRIEYHEKLQRFIDETNKPGEVLRIRLDKNYRLQQQKGEYKYMDWYLIPKDLFASYCLEVADRDKMTYNNL
jgi:hypothetical protein